MLNYTCCICIFSSITGIYTKFIVFTSVIKALGNVIIKYLLFKIYLMPLVDIMIHLVVISRDNKGWASGVWRETEAGGGAVWRGLPYAGGKGMERDVGNLGSVPDVMESLDSRSGGVSFSISWMLRSDCLHTSYNTIRSHTTHAYQSFQVFKKT